MACFVIWPGQLIETNDATVPPLNASICFNCLDARKVKDALVIPGDLKEMLLVVNCPHGPDRNQAPVPQLIKPLGY